MVLARLAVDTAGTWTLRWTSAGHPPPLLIGPDGLTRYLTEANGMLLGMPSPRPRTEARLTLPPQSTLVLYTDGLVEARRKSLDAGLENLRRHAASLVHHDLDDFADQLLRRTRPQDNDDDVALLVLRLPS
jgi:serine phosphatase RsbU (regulator of sigma subunit)